MSAPQVFDGSFDVVIAAGPRTWPWPSVGAWAISTLCTEMGLKVGMYGGSEISVRGILPLPGVGAILVAEDAQRRVHRIHTRAVVRISSSLTLADSFPGSQSQAVIPLATAQFLWARGFPLWEPCTVILGSGNRALRFGSRLLENGVPEVICVESAAHWEGKRYAGWEVERRRFEINGGMLIEGQPLDLSQKGALLWDLRITDRQKGEGEVRTITTSRVVTAGPFSSLSAEAPVKEYPPGSLLFELEQSAALTEAEDVDGWRLEEERARSIGLKIVRSLVTDLQEKKEQYDRILRRTRARLKRFHRHRTEPFCPVYQGKWMTAPDMNTIRAFAGVPQGLHRKRLVASIECFESVSCNICQRVCPTGAIDKSRILKEADCTACGICLQQCPSNAIVMMKEQADLSNSFLVVSWRGAKPWKTGEFTQLVNRRGDVLGNGRVVEELTAPEALDERHPVQLVRVELPTHLLWETRGLRRQRNPGAAEDQSFLTAESRAKTLPEKVEILVNGEKRLATDKISVSTALFEMGYARAEDVFHCVDGSCGLCHVFVDGVKKLGCKTPVHRGMSIDLPGMVQADEKEYLCRCLKIESKSVIERVRQGKLKSPEAVISVTHVGEGKCHGERCMESFRRILAAEGLEVGGWIDWRFPWSDWSIIGS